MLLVEIRQYEAVRIQQDWRRSPACGLYKPALPGGLVSFRYRFANDLGLPAESRLNQKITMLRSKTAHLAKRRIHLEGADQAALSRMARRSEVRNANPPNSANVCWRESSFSMSSSCVDILTQSR